MAALTTLMALGAAGKAAGAATRGIGGALAARQMFTKEDRERLEEGADGGDRVAARVRAGLEEMLGIDRLQPADVAEEPDGTAVAVLVVGLAVMVERVAESGVQRAENL